ARRNLPSRHDLADGAHRPQRAHLEPVASGTQLEYGRSRRCTCGHTRGCNYGGNHGNKYGSTYGSTYGSKTRLPFRLLLLAWPGSLWLFFCRLHKWGALV